MRIIDIKGTENNLFRVDEVCKSRIKHGLFAGVITALIFAAICVCCQLAPLGDNTFLMYDLKRQYVDYYSYFKSIVTGENNALYSFSTALGSGMIGFDIYYISSPFLLILSLFPQVYLPAGITVVIGIKLALATFIMDMYLQYYLGEGKQFCIKEVAGIKIALGAVSWGLSSFLFAHSMNMMWIDVIMLVPAVLWALDRVILTNRKITYCVFISVILFLNYYITYQIMIFIAIWTFYRVWILRVNNPVKAIVRVVVTTFIGGICDAVVLLPTALELMDSPKDITQLGLHTKNNNLSVFQVLSKAPALAYDYIEARFGWPQIYCGVIFVALIILFFISKKIQIREKIGIFVIMSILMFSFMNDKFNLVWHAGMEPSGHPYRQAYLWIFLVIICGTKVLLSMEELSGVPVFVSLIITGAIFGLSMRTRYEHNTKFAIIVNVGIIAAYILVFSVFAMLKNMKNRQLIVMLIVVIMQIAELTGNAGYTYKWQSQLNTHYSEYKNAVSQTAATVEWVKSQDDSFYRMENLNPRQQNDAMQYVYNGVTHYSSAGKTYVRYLLQRMGFNDDGLYTHYGHDNTVTEDMILGVKYIISDGTYAAHNAYDMIHDDNVDAYLNPYALSVAVETNGFDLSDISCEKEVISSDNWDEYVPGINPFALQEEFVNRIAGKQYEIFKPAEVETVDSEETGEDGIVYPRREFTVTASMDGEMFLYLDGLIGSRQGLTLFKDGEVLSTYGNAACVKILNLGYMSKGDQVNIFIGDGQPDADFGEAYFVTEDITEVAKAYADLQERNATVTKNSSSHLTINTGDCDGVFLTIPCETGWSAKVDGVKVEPVCVFGALTYIPVENSGDSHVVEVTFVTEGLLLGLTITVIGLALLVAMIILEKKAVKHEQN